MAAGSLHLTPLFLSLLKSTLIGFHLTSFPSLLQQKAIVYRYSECFVYYYSSISLNVAFHQETHTLGEDANELMSTGIHSFIINSILEVAGSIKQWNDWSKSQIWCQLELSVLKGRSAILEVTFISAWVWCMVQALIENMDLGTKTEKWECHFSELHLIVLLQ